MIYAAASSPTLKGGSFIMSWLRNLIHGRSVGTPQMLPLAQATQVRNGAGGYVFTLAPLDRVDRFLILGSEGGTYYAAERVLTIENVAHLAALARTDGAAVLDRVIAISESGRAPKVSPAIFALALIAGLADDATRARALDEGLRRVCRTGSHLLEFCSYVKQFRGWGRGLRRAIGAWYEARSVGDLAYQVVKYRDRAGYTHRDVFRLVHPRATETERAALYAWIARETLPETDTPALAILGARAKAHAATEPDAQAWAELTRESGLPREALPSAWLREPAVWEALLPHLGQTALLRNLATLTRVGLLTPGSQATRTVAERLADPVRLRKARVHPIAVLAALETYRSGHSARGHSQWKPVAAIVDALDAAFGLAFESVAPTGARTLVGLDVSGSMAGGFIAGIPGLTPRVGAAALALTHVRTDASVRVQAFSNRFVGLPIAPGDSVASIVQRTSGLPFEATDCALPMLYALEQRLAIDVFVVYTDNETLAGAIHPVEALRTYRERTGIPAKLVVAGLTSTGFTIADPNDAGTLDVVGFDSAAPTLIADFCRVA
jgi:60 kDa SS-A/Ro ribonucleoprotein